MIEVPVEPWLHTDFKRVLREGEPLLNASFDQIEERLINATFDSIGVFQELCKHSCIAAGVEDTQTQTVLLKDEHLDLAIETKLDDYSSRHIRSLETFIEQRAKSSEEVPLYIAYYFVVAILKNEFDDITRGFKRKDIQEMIKQDHHRPGDVRSSDLSYFLHNIVSNQIKKNIIPPLFDYDSSTRLLKIIDSTFYFFLQNVDKEEIIEELEKPNNI